MTEPLLDRIADLTEQIDRLTAARRGLMAELRAEPPTGCVVTHDSSLPVVAPDEPPSREVV